ncbi:hypothetical protein ACFL02_01455 [Planctomycetota bacterium]
MSQLETTNAKSGKAPKKSQKLLKRILLTFGLFLGITAGWLLFFPSYISPAYDPNHAPEPTAGREISFTGFDGLAHVGEEVILQAKLETKYLRNDIENETVECRVEGENLGAARTDEEGFVRWRFMPKETGNFTVFYQLPAEAGYKPKRTTGLLAVRTDEKPILVTDLDHTVIDISTYQFIHHDNENIPPLPGAVEILNGLTEDYDIIYLTARDDLYVNVTKYWLDMYGLPRAPLFVCDLSEEPVDQGAFKKEVLKKLKAQWPKITIGVGDKVHDAEAYLANGMEAYIIGEHDELPDKTISVTSWKEIQEKLKK